MTTQVVRADQVLVGDQVTAGLAPGTTTVTGRRWVVRAGEAYVRLETTTQGRRYLDADTLLTISRPAGPGGDEPAIDPALDAAVTALLGNDESTTGARLGAAFGRFRPATFVGMGDSITADGGRVWNGYTAADRPLGDGLTNTWSWHFWGQLLSDSRAEWLGNFGSPGKTIEQLRDDYLPYLLAKNPLPTYCVLLAGQNNLGALTGATLAAYTTIVTRLRDAGIVPILCTLTPSTTDRRLFVLNAHIRQLARLNGLPLVDLYAATIDPATGTWQAPLTRDGVHPTAAGAHAMGQALADVLVKLAPVNGESSWLPKAQAGFGGGRAGTGGDGNVLFLDDQGASGYPNAPVNWAILAGYHDSVLALTTPGAPVAGRRMKLTYSAAAGQPVARYMAVGDAQAGDRMLLTFRLSADVEAHGGGWALGVIDSTGQSHYDIGRNSGTLYTSDVQDKVYVARWTQGSDAVAWLDLVVGGGDGASASLSECAFYNLTALGVA